MSTGISPEPLNPDSSRIGRGSQVYPVPRCRKLAQCLFCLPPAPTDLRWRTAGHGVCVGRGHMPLRGWLDGAVSATSAPATRGARNLPRRQCECSPGWNEAALHHRMWAWPGPLEWPHAACACSGTLGSAHRMRELGQESFHPTTLWSACPRQQLDLDSQSVDSEPFLSQPAFPGSQSAGSIPWGLLCPGQMDDSFVLRSWG